MLPLVILRVAGSQEWLQEVARLGYTALPTSTSCTFCPGSTLSPSTESRGWLLYWITWIGVVLKVFT